MALNRKMCQELIQKSVQLVHSYDPHIPLKSQIDRIGILDSVKIPIDTLKNTSQVIGVRNIFAHPLLRISIYHLPKGITMKLHDHPTMNVVSYILKGSMTAHIFNPVSNSPLYEKKTIQLSQNSYELVEGAKDNLHEFSAISKQCYFMDIIFPDYDDQMLLCTHYDYTEHSKTKDNKILYSLKENKGYFPPMIQI